MPDSESERETPQEKLTGFTIKVIDEGRGILDAEESIFLARTRNTSTEINPTVQNSLLGHESNGIGLSICKRIAESLGGELVYVNQNFGCRFDLKVRVKMLEQNVFTEDALNYLNAPEVDP